MDISRQQFELFIKLHTEPKELKDRLVTVNAGKNYRNVQTDLMWVAWKESRNSLKPVGFTNEDELNYREKEETNGLFFSTIDNECCHIPLYRLDK